MATRNAGGATRGYAPGQDPPLASYGMLMATLLGSSGAFAWWLGRSGRPVPDRPELGDLALVSIAAHKASRLLAKDRVASPLRAPFTRYEDDGAAGEVSETPRGRGLRRAVGELLVCPYCIGAWMAAAFTASLLVAPRLTRWACVALTTVAVSDFLQIAYRKAEDTL